MQVPVDGSRSLSRLASVPQCCDNVARVVAQRNAVYMSTRNPLSYILYLIIYYTRSSKNTFKQTHILTYSLRGPQSDNEVGRQQVDQ